MEKVITVQVSGPRLLIVSLCLALNTFPDIAAHEAVPQVTPKYPGDGTHKSVDVAVLPALPPAPAANTSARWRRRAHGDAVKRPSPDDDSPPSRVVAILHGAPEERTAASAQGYRIFVSVNDDLETFREAILAATRGESYCSPLLTAKLIGSSDRRAHGHAEDAQGIPREALTKQQRNVATLAAAGFSNAEIAVQLCVGIDAVKAHLRETYKKLGIERRSQLPM